MIMNMLSHFIKHGDLKENCSCDCGKPIPENKLNIIFSTKERERRDIGEAYVQQWTVVG
jgi:hypothetical protein